MHQIDYQPIFNKANSELWEAHWVYLNIPDNVDLNDWQFRLAWSFASAYDDSLVFIYFPKESFMTQFNEFYNIPLLNLNLKNGSQIILSDSQKMLGVDENQKKPNGFHNENMLFIINKAHWFHKATNVMTAIKNTSTGRNNLILAIDDISKEEQEVYSTHPRFKVFDTND